MREPRAYRVAPCALGDPDHEHSRACLARLISRLPQPPLGWKWAWGRSGSGWSIFLESPRGGEFHVVGLSPAHSIGDLASIVSAYLAGLDGPPIT